MRIRNAVQNGSTTSMNSIGCQRRGARAMPYAIGKPIRSSNTVETAAISRLLR